MNNHDIHIDKKDNIIDISIVQKYNTNQAKYNTN